MYNLGAISTFIHLQYIYPQILHMQASIPFIQASCDKVNRQEANRNNQRIPGRPSTGALLGASPNSMLAPRRVPEFMFRDIVFSSSAFKDTSFRLLYPTFGQTGINSVDH